MFRSILFIALTISSLTISAADELAEGAAQIDRLLQASWQRDAVTPAPISGDAEFCRRVWLDLAGVAPPIAELRSFLQDTTDNKRELLIDRLLVSPQFANHMASRWNEILLPADAQTQFEQQANVAALHEWLRKQFRQNVPYDHFVGGFLTAGGAGDRGPAIFYTSHSLAPEKLAAATSRIFMGVQLQCAQCHDHPFDRWTQKDFWQYAAFFSQLQQTDAQPGRGNVMIEDRVGSEVTLPDSEEVMSPRYPGVAEPPDENPGDIRRRQLTIWMASRDNPYFARAAANRAWAHLFGRGLVDPVDAMDAKNLPSHPELLDFLADHFTQHRFDLRNLYATLARTDAYRRSSSVTGDRPPETSFAAMTVKTLTAEQFFDSLQQNVYRRSTPVTNDPMSADRATRQQFLSRMRAPGMSPQDYPHGVVQVLGMMNGPEMDAATGTSIGLLGTLEAPLFSDQDRIDTLFLATLSRFPSDLESAKFLDHLNTASTSVDKQAMIGDLLWVLLNTAECAVCP
jgi:Protein of unknown function (DUF1549)/Protein of unknown function (DUF1553)